MINGDVLVMSNIMNFQDFDILSYGMFEIRGYIYVKCDSRHFCPANSLPIAIWSRKKNRGVFFMVFSINYTIPYRTPKEDPQTDLI